MPSLLARYEHRAIPPVAQIFRMNRTRGFHGALCTCVSVTKSILSLRALKSLILAIEVTKKCNIRQLSFWFWEL
ncbi:hypothetical protein LguiB_018761 [Lonicera macranthoides]